MTHANVQAIFILKPTLILPMPNIPTYPYPLPTAAPEYVVRMQTLYAHNYGANLNEKDAKELLETLMRLVYLTQLHHLNALHDALHPLR